MRSFVLVLAGLLLAGATGACGGGGGGPGTTTAAPTAPPARTTPGGGASSGSRADRDVVAGWAGALRDGRIARADAYFDVPALVAQGGGAAVRLTTRAQVHAFDLSLPCGARLTRTVAHHRYLLAEFRLTERRGPGGGACDGPGGLAATAFLIRDGHIVEWRRIAGLPGPGSSPTPTPTEPDVPSSATPA